MNFEGEIDSQGGSVFLEWCGRDVKPVRVGWATCILGEMSSLEGNGLSKGEICMTYQV